VSVERAAVGQSVTYPVAPQQVASDIVPAMQVPEPPDNTIGFGTMAITKARGVKFGWTGEEQRALNTGAGYLDVQGQMFAEGLRTLVNEIETDLAIEAGQNASRAIGTPGTAPFADKTLDQLADLRKILDDNGTPSSMRSAILSTASGANLRKTGNLIKVNEAGTQMTLRDGELLNVFGFSLKESGQSGTFTAGTAAGSTTLGTAALPFGTTVIPIAAAGTGTIKKGDFVKFAGDVNLYGVQVGNANVAGGGSITLAGPGLRVAQPVGAQSITVSASHAVNVGFSMDALAIAMRAPALPQQGDLALDRMNMTDPRSGMSFEISLYPGYRKIEAEVAVAWGVKAVKPQHIAMLMG